MAFLSFHVENLERKRKKKKGKEKKGKGKEKGEKEGEETEREKEGLQLRKKKEEASRLPPSTVRAAAIHRRSPSPPPTPIFNGKLPDLEFRVDFDFDLKNTIWILV